MTFDLIKWKTGSHVWLQCYILVNQWTWLRHLCHAYCVAADELLLLMTCNDAHPITSSQINFSWFPRLSCYIHHAFVFISCSPATRACIGVAMHAARVHICCELLHMCAVLGGVSAQLLWAYAAWACTNRLCAAQAGLVWLKLVKASFTPVEAVTYYCAEWISALAWFYT